MIRSAVPFVLLLATQGMCQQWLFSNIGSFNPLSALFGGGNSEGFASGGGSGFGGNVFTNADFPLETSGSEAPEVFLRTVYLPNFFGGGRGGGGSRGLRGPIMIRGPPTHEQAEGPHEEGPPSLGSHPFPSFSNFPEGAFSNDGPRQNSGPRDEGNFQGPYLGADSIQGPPPNFQHGPSNNFDQEPSNNFQQGPNNFQQGPNNFQQGPNNFQQGLNNFQQGPNNFQQGPNNFQQGPNNFQQGPNNFQQGPNNFQQGPNNFQGPHQNFQQQGPNEFHQGPPPNFQQGQSHQNFQQGGNSGGFRIEGPFNGPPPQFQNFDNQNNEGQQVATSTQARGIPIPVSGNVIPVKVQMPQAHGQPIIQNALLLLVPPNIPIQGESRFQGNLAAAAAAAGRAAFQMQQNQQQNNHQGQNQHILERGFRPIPQSNPVKNHPNHQMESSIQYHQAHDLPHHGGYVPFSPSAPYKILKPLQAKKFLASKPLTQKVNQGSSLSHQKKYVSMTSSDAKPSNGEVLKKVVRVTQSSNQQKVIGRSMPNTSASSKSTTVIDMKPAASTLVMTNVTAPANKTLSG